jgi:ribosomal-protein-alanine N-acetyltransferase
MFAMPSQIETSRLVLRDPHGGDADTLVRELNNYNIARNTSRIPYPYHHMDAVDFLHRAGNSAPPSAVWAIALKSDPASLIGVISLQHDQGKNNAELGYWLSQSLWANGFGTEAAEAVVTHAFNSLKLETLVACFHVDNPASGRILQRLGFADTGKAMSFSLAQNTNVPVTWLHLPCATWKAKKGREQ